MKSLVPCPWTGLGLSFSGYSDLLLKLSLVSLPDLLVTEADVMTGDNNFLNLSLAYTI